MRIIGFGIRGTAFPSSGLCARCFHQRQQRLPLHFAWNCDRRLPKHGGSDIHQADSSVYLLTRRVKPGKLDDQWHVNSGVIQENTMRVLAMLAKRLTVIRHHGDKRFVIQALGAQRSKKTTQLRVHVGDLAVIRIGLIAAFERLRRIVRIMGVVKVYPQEKWPCLSLAEPGERMVYHFAGATFHRFVAIGAAWTKPEARVINLETPIKPRRRATQRIKYKRGDEGGRVIPALAQNVGRVGQFVRKRNSEIDHMIELRVSPRKNRGMRSCGQRDVRVGMRKHRRLTGQCIQIWRQPALPSEKAHAIGASSVQGYKNEDRKST